MWCTQFHQPKPRNVFWDWLSHIIPEFSSWNDQREKPNEACGAVPQHVHVGDCHVPAGIRATPQDAPFFTDLITKKKMITYVWTFHNKSSTTTIIHILYNHIVTYFYNTCVYPILDHQQIKLVSFFLAYYVYHESPWADARFQRHLHHAMFRDHFSLQTVEKTPHRTWSCWSGTRK